MDKDLKSLLFQYTADIQEAAALANSGLKIDGLEVPKPEKGALSEALLNTAAKKDKFAVEILVKRDPEDIRKELEIAKQGEFIAISKVRPVTLLVSVKPRPVTTTTGGVLNQDQFKRYRDFKSKGVFKGLNPEFGSSQTAKGAEIFAKLPGDSPDN